MGYSALQRERRLNAMITAFPEAAVEISHEFIESLDCPDPDDRHVLAAAKQGHANAIVTNNVRDSLSTVGRNMASSVKLQTNS